jgi:hypothetical protein
MGIYLGYGSITSGQQLRRGTEDNFLGLGVHLSRPAQSEECALPRSADDFKDSQRRLYPSAILQPIDNRFKNCFDMSIAAKNWAILAG